MNFLARKQFSKFVRDCHRLFEKQERFNGLALMGIYLVGFPGSRRLELILLNGVERIKLEVYEGQG